MRSVHINRVIASVNAARPKPPVRQVTRPVAAKHTAWNTAGFAPMTRISTSFGEVPAQALRERDPVRTQTGEYLRIVWLDRIVLDEDFMSRHPEAHPVLIRAGAFRSNRPHRDILLSPGQKLCAEDRLVGGKMQAAHSLLGKPYVARKPEMMMTYTLFHLGKPANVRCEGVWVNVDPS